MCGIFSILNNDGFFQNSEIVESFNKGQSRGPEHTHIDRYGYDIQLGFHRLAINGLNDVSNQPICIGDIVLICNGEIYNHKELYNCMEDVSLQTNSDCEIIIHLYLKFGIEYTLKLLDGVFAFILLDNRLSNDSSLVYIARDPYGVRPLFIMKPNLLSYGYNSDKRYIFGFASEMKMLVQLQHKINNDSHVNNMYNIQQFQPGTFSKFILGTEVSGYWRLLESHYYNSLNMVNMHPLYSNLETIDFNYYAREVQYNLCKAVDKRCVNTDRPIACLLSGGLDSSIIAALVCDIHEKHGLPKVHTYSIGLKDSVDLKYAKIVADYIGSIHTEVILSEDDFINAIPEVIYITETYDTTSVRASIGNYLIGKHISQNSDAKVIFNGDGADELMGGYLYMKAAPDMLEFDKETRRLLHNIHYFDVLRSDRSISSNGLEPRTPYLDRNFVQSYMSIPVNIRYAPDMIEKNLLRTAFSPELFKNSKNLPLLPHEILFRKKEAFSDGVSGKERSLYQIIGDHCNALFEKEDAKYINTGAQECMKNVYMMSCALHPNMKSVNMHNPPLTAEQFYYRKIFEQYYKGNGRVIPYFWMPKYVDAADASARTLKLYTV
jgi:asparagine synthase (glutamine-hydrolysing)